MAKVLRSNTTPYGTHNILDGTSFHEMALLGSSWMALFLRGVTKVIQLTASMKAYDSTAKQRSMFHEVCLDHESMPPKAISRQFRRLQVIVGAIPKAIPYVQAPNVNPSTCSFAQDSLGIFLLV